MPLFGHHKNSSCRICGGTDLFQYLDLGDQPPSNAFIDASEIPAEQRFPLTVYLCRSCGSSQLIDVVHGADVFADYVYLSSTSRALREHFQGMVDTLLDRHQVAQGSVVVDVGANDGVTLDRYPAGKFHLVGVEPSSAGRYAVEKGHTIIQDFFGKKTGERIKSEFGPVQLATATNVCAHVDDITDFMQGFSAMLSPTGVVAFECSYLPDMVDGNYFDTVYHEHLNYHALTPLMVLFERAGLKAVRAERIALGASGPAIRVTAALASSAIAVDPSVETFLAEEKAWGILDDKPYVAFADRVAKVIREIRAAIADAKAKGQRIGAFSAPAKGNTLLNSAGLTPEDLEVVAENNDLKVGKVTPGSHIPIVSDADFMAMKLDLALLLSWNYADFFVANSPFVKSGGKFLIPLPAPVVRP